MIPTMQNSKNSLPGSHGLANDMTAPDSHQFSATAPYQASSSTVQDQLLFNQTHNMQMPQMPPSMNATGNKFRRRKGSKSAAQKNDRRYKQRSSKQQL